MLWDYSFIYSGSDDGGFIMCGTQNWQDLSPYGTTYSIRNMQDIPYICICFCHVEFMFQWGKILAASSNKKVNK